ncbi:MAG: NAD(P)H-hydrate dehydratase [Spirochaetes bacterium]|nr:NAD(P)H-hydrate dehydratase [Spirochaetota bacterium]
MFLVSADEMRAIDRASIDEFQIPSDLLMYIAGKEAADVIASSVSKDKTIIVFCGQGNNGGDGFVIAWLLFLQGYSITIFFNGTSGKLSADSLKYHELCRICDIEFTDDFNFRHDVVIDSLLGTGFKGDLRIKEKEIVISINNSGSFVFSIDIPSGLPSDGNVEDGLICIHADETLAIGLAKINQFTYPGKSFCGKVTVLRNIFPPELLDIYSKRRLIDEPFSFSMPEKNKNTNKYKEGCVHIVSGSEGMEGAALLAASSLLTSGCGIAKLFCPSESRNIIAGKIPELLTFSSDELTAADVINDVKYDILLGGSGAGRNENSEKIFNIFIVLVNSGFYRKCIIDGDWLYMLSQLENFCFQKQCRVVLTPHDGEGARLLGMKSSEFIKNRVYHAEEISLKYKAVTVLKGSDTIITDGFSTVIINAGNESLATAGSGDVLAGIIASVMIKIDDPLEAAVIAVHIHGKCAELLTGNRENRTIRASELIDVIHDSIETLYSSI